MAIRWDALPEDKTRLNKDQVMKKLAKQKLIVLYKASDKRDMKQKNGSMKAVRCIVVGLSAFQPAVYDALANGT